jgi:hypothetical protein
MNKQEILRKEGLTEEQFYNLYPTQEAYLMKCGGALPKGQNGSNIVPDGLGPEKPKPVTPTNKTIPGQDSSNFFETRKLQLTDFLGKSAKPAFDRDIKETAHNEFMSQFQPQMQTGMPMAQSGVQVRRDKNILGEDWDPNMYNQQTGTFQPFAPEPYTPPNYGVGPQYGQPSGQYQIGPGLPKSNQFGIGAGSNVQPIHPVNKSLAPNIPDQAGDESIPEPQHEMSNDYLRKMISSNTWQGGLPDQTYMANSQYDLGEMMDIEKSHDKDKTAQAGAKGVAGKAFDWMGLVNMINTGVGTMAQLGENRKQDAYRKAHRAKPEDWSAM